MRCRPSWSLSTLGSKHACDKNRRSSVTYASIISVFPPHLIPSSRTTKYAVCCCCLHTKESCSDLYSVPSNIRIGPTDANAFRGHRLTTQKGYTYATYKTRDIFLKKTLGSYETVRDLQIVHLAKFSRKFFQGFTWTAKISTGGKLTVDPPFSFRRERGTGKI